jgi:predicted nucleic acid-binding protein
MIVSYVDSGVLIAAYRGSTPIAALALAMLNDQNREFVTSEFVRLEVIPKPAYHHRSGEIAFYEAYFSATKRSALITPTLVQLAMRRAVAYGLSAIDALHVAAAESVGADELLTSERVTSPLLRITTIRVVSLQSSATP